MMTSIQTMHIDQALPPAKRWQLSDSQIKQIQALVGVYVEDMGGVEQFSDSIESLAQENLNGEFFQELVSISEQCQLPLVDILVTNLYYDLFKIVIGCTAFAIDTEDGPLHARNLDWWTTSGLLSKHTLINHFHASKDQMEFKTIAWPGYCAALSGIAPGRFSITLNAVLSDESHGLENSISFLIREVLATAKDYDEAIARLSCANIIPDCLLLVSGVKQGEMCVIERTPTRSAIRHPENGFIVVANDYQLIDADSLSIQNELQASSCGRYQTTVEQIKKSRPQTTKACFDILSHPQIMMGITVQQMVMSASKKYLDVVVPNKQ